MSDKYVYRFSEGNKTMKELLGGKGANLAEMTVIGLPVPPGFTITTEVCNHYSPHGKGYPDGVDAPGRGRARRCSRPTWARRSATPPTRCWSRVRSGARASMPGMMDTVLNLGLNDETVQGIIAQHRQRALRLRLLPPLRPDVRRRRPRLQARERRRGRRVRGAPRGDEEGRGVEARHRPRPPTTSRSSSPSSRRRQGAHRQRLPRRSRGAALGAVGAVFGSWSNDRADRSIGDLNGIPDDWGTAVNVQTMVFGNMGDDCGTGVALHPRPGHRRERLLRRVPRSTRRARTSSPASARRAGDRAARRILAGRLRRAHRHPPDAREPLPRHAGHRVHDREGPALHAADAQRQAHRPRPRSASPSTWATRA